MSKLAYSLHEAADECGISSQTIVLAIRERELVARSIEDKILIANYDLEMWLLGLPNYLDGADERAARADNTRAELAADRQARSDARRAKKLAKETELREIGAMRERLAELEEVAA